MRIILFLLFFAFDASSAPKWTKQLSPSKVGSHPPIGSSELEFSLSWKGMPKAGVLNIQFAPKDLKKPGSFVVKSSASSRGAAAALYPYTHSYWSEINPRSLQSKLFHATESNSDETVTTTNRYTSSKVLLSEQTVESETGKSKLKKEAFP
jgi:hypothetical protein